MFVIKDLPVANEFPSSDLSAYMANAFQALIKVSNDVYDKSNINFTIKTPEGEINYNQLKMALEELASMQLPSAYEAACMTEIIHLTRQAETELNLEPSQISIPVTELLAAKATKQMLQLDENVNLEQIYTDLKELFGETTPLVKQENYLPGADFRRLPNYRALGINREAGFATDEEIVAFKGQTRADGSPVGASDFFSTGALLANNDLIEDRSMRIPALEMARLGSMLEIRAKGSDYNHEFKAEDCTFRIIAPKIGTDLNIKLNSRLGNTVKEPYTGLSARLLFPITEGKAQKDAVEDVRRGLLQDLSITPLFDAYTCGSCGELSISDVQLLDGKVTVIKLANVKDKRMLDLREHYKVIFRIPEPAVLGSFVYYESHVLSSENGILSISPMDIPIKDGTKVMCKMEMLPIMFAGGYMPRYCSVHGLQGWIDEYDTAVVANVCNIRGLMNVAFASSGAIKDARIVLDPDVAV